MKEYAVYGYFNSDRKIDCVNISSSSPAAAAQLVVDRMRVRGTVFRPVLVFSGTVRELWREGT